MDNTLPELPGLLRSPQRNDLLNRYETLQSQQTDYRRRASSNPSSPSRGTSDSSSTATSPTTHASPLASSPSHFSLSSTPQTTDDPVDDALYEVNNAIKPTLTDLLNCEAVKCDGKWRSWCQARLMDAELELKRQRRRRVNSCVLGSLEDGEGRRES